MLNVQIGRILHSAKAAGATVTSVRAAARQHWRSPTARRSSCASRSLALALSWRNSYKLCSSPFSRPRQSHAATLLLHLNLLAASCYCASVCVYVCVRVCVYVCVRVLEAPRTRCDSASVPRLLLASSQRAGAECAPWASAVKVAK